MGEEHFNVANDCTNGLFFGCDLKTNSVAINVGGTVGQCNGMRISHCTLQAVVLLGCASVEVDNCNFYAFRGQALIPDIIGRGHFHHNIFRDAVDYNTGHGAISAFGTGSTDAVLMIDHNEFYGLDALFHAPDGGEGIINLENFRGTALITENLVDRCTSGASTPDHGAFVCVRGANTGPVFLGPNVLRGRAGSNMAIGYFIDATVPADKVIIAPGSYFGESVTTKWSLGAACLAPVDLMYELEERTDAAAPDNTRVRIYARDTGGKTELVARFNTGVIQQIAIEP